MSSKDKTVPIDEFLSKKILDRLDLKEGKVTVANESWDLGFCDTCSWAEYGFAVYVDGNLVWPNDESLSALGGYVYADDRGEVVGGELSTYGYFFEWLDRKDLQELANAEDDDCEECKMN